MLYILRSRLLLYSAGSGANRVQVVLFWPGKNCMLVWLNICLRYTRACVCRCDLRRPWPEPVVWVVVCLQCKCWIVLAFMRSSAGHPTGPHGRLAQKNMLTAQLCDTKFCRFFSVKSAGRTELRKHSLFKRLPAGTWPCRELAAFVSCFFFSTLAHTSVLMSRGAIPAIRYSSLTLIGLKHPVIDLYGSFSSGSNLEACGDLAPAGHVYSAAECDSANAVVLIMIAL